MDCDKTPLYTETLSLVRWTHRTAKKKDRVEGNIGFKDVFSLSPRADILSISAGGKHLSDHKNTFEEATRCWITGKNLQPGNTRWPNHGVNCSHKCGWLSSWTKCLNCPLITFMPCVTLRFCRLSEVSLRVSGGNSSLYTWKSLACCLLSFSDNQHSHFESITAVKSISVN